MILIVINLTGIIFWLLEMVRLWTVLIILQSVGFAFCLVLLLCVIYGSILKNLMIHVLFITFFLINDLDLDILQVNTGFRVLFRFIIYWVRLGLNLWSRIFGSGFHSTILLWVLSRPLLPLVSYKAFCLPFIIVGIVIW